MAGQWTPNPTAWMIAQCNQRLLALQQQLAKLQAYTVPPATEIADVNAAIVDVNRAIAVAQDDQ